MSVVGCLLGWGTAVQSATSRENLTVELWRDDELTPATKSPSIYLLQPCSASPAAVLTLSLFLMGFLLHAQLAILCEWNCRTS